MTRLLLLAFSALVGFGCMVIAAVAADIVSQPPDAVSSPAAGNDVLLSGYIEAWGGFSIVDPCCSASIEDEDYPAIGGAGRVSIPIGSAFSIQLDIEGQKNFATDDTGASNYHSSFTGGGHLSYRNPDRYLLGVFGAGGEADGEEFSSPDPEPTYWMVGVEGQYYADNYTLYGQVGYLDSEVSGDDSFRDAFFLRGVGRYFPTDQSMITVDLEFARGKLDDFSGGGGPLEFSDAEMFSWGARYDRVIADSPWSWFVSYRGFTNDKTGGTEFDEVVENSFLAGLRAAFGTSSLKSLDRQGATLDLPDAGRWVGYSVEVID